MAARWRWTWRSATRELNGEWWLEAGADALAGLRQPVLLVTATDSRAELRLPSEALAAVLPNAQLIVSRAVTQTGPLPGAYSKSDLPELDRRLRSREWSLRGVNPRVLEADPRLLANVNTPAELSALEQDLAALDQHRA